MNLFCFTLDGSTESVYEPPYSQTLIDALPKSRCSRTEWGGSSPSISPSGPKPKRENRRSCAAAAAASTSADRTSDGAEVSGCWESNRKDGSLQRTVQDGGVCNDDPLGDFLPQEVKQQSSRTQSAEAPGRLKRLQNLVQARRGRKSPSGDGGKASGENPVLTCIGRGGKKPAPPEPTGRLLRPVAGDDGDDDDDVWSPNGGNLPLWSSFGCSQPWTPLHHGCTQPGHQLWACGGGGGGGGGTLSLPRAAEWDRFQSLIQELDSKQSPPQMIRSITDLHLSQNKSSRFWRGDASSRRSQDKTRERELGGGGGELDGSGPDASSQSGGKHDEASPQRRKSELDGGGVPTDEARKTEASGGGGGGGRPFGKGRRRSSNSLESLYSLSSGQSSSSGVTSGSDCSSDRNSLRLDDDPSPTRRLGGRARVHTEYVPSPYDTESLKLEVGDVIDIIATPPMGIWRGSLRGQVGSFKFVYVDVLPEESEESEGSRHRSTVQEVLRRLSLEEYSASLQLAGYQTVDDLTRLSEPRLAKLNVTDPEHRQRLLAAVRSLRLLNAERQQDGEADWEDGENAKANANNCPRDSGCHMASEGSEAAAEEEAELHLTESRG